MVADINDDHLTLDDRGCYTLLLSAAPPSEAAVEAGVSFLRLPPNAATVVTRHYFEQQADGADGDMVHAQLHPRTRGAIVLDIAKVTPLTGKDIVGVETSTITDGEMARLEHCNFTPRKRISGILA